MLACSSNLSDLTYFRRKRQETSKTPDCDVEGNICPAPESVLGRILPRLEAVAMTEIVRGFPEVEGLVTVLNWSISCSYQVGS